MDDLTRLSYWFPRIEAAGLPVPKTRIYRLLDGQVEDLMKILDNDDAGLATFDALKERLRKIIRDDFAYPVFLRTDFTSGKHQWNETCFVRQPSDLGKSICRLVEYSCLADLFGLPFDTWVVREMLTTEPRFHAFYGMPVTREFRLFVRDGVVEHVQPYWPPDSIERPTTDDWRDRLAAMNAITDNERLELSALARRANDAVPGYWSVDFLETKDRGWVLIDMAEGEKSYRWSPSDDSTND